MPDAQDAGVAKRVKVDADGEAKENMDVDGLETAESRGAKGKGKGKGKESTGAEKRVHKQEGIKLPIELIGRVFDFYYDLVHDGKLYV